MTNSVLPYHFLLQYADPKLLTNIGDEERNALLEKIILIGQSANSWNAVLELFTTWPNNAARIRAYETAESLMKNWKEEERVINSSWKLLYKDNELSSTAMLARCIEINRREANGKRELLVIASSANAQNIIQLQIDRSDINEESIKALANFGTLQKLASLLFNGIAFIDNSFQILVESSNLRHLRKLSLRNCGVYADKLDMLMVSKIILQLQSLSLAYNSLGYFEACKIAKSSFAKNIETLDLSDNSINDEGAEALITSTSLQNLKTLILTGNSIKDISTIANSALKIKNLNIII